MTVEEFKALPKDKPILVHCSEDLIPYYVVKKCSEEPDYYQNKYYLTEAGSEEYSQYFIDEIDDWCTMEELDEFFKNRQQAFTKESEEEFDEER